jgi:hypothetical protein
MNKALNRDPGTHPVVLRGLLYMPIDRQQSLASHVRKKHDHAGKALFQDENACVALTEIFTNVLQDPSLNSTYLAIGVPWLFFPKKFCFSQS